ncbi:MAG: hypothetical protein IKN42_01465 [Elusimicrobia bacterium]|nr:hypothetical protein [Elusimicrobiota bacterium]
MKNKKILSSILVLTLMFALSSFVQAKPDVEISTYTAVSDFEDMIPSLTHSKPYVYEVISCNMVLKPKTQIDLSRLCSSAVTNVNYYFNGSESNIQKGPDYNNTVKEEVFYPATKRISNSYLGGTISYRVGSELQTKKSSGEKINLKAPKLFKNAVIISSKIVHIEDMGVAYTLYQPTGDQSQPDWVGVMKGYPALAGRSGNWTFRFGTLEDAVSSAFSFFKSSKAGNRTLVLANLNAMNLSEDGNSWDDILGDGTDNILYLGSAQPNDESAVYEICKKAKRLVMEYNLNPRACDGSQVLIEEGWLAIDADQAKKYLKITSTGIEYPEFLNAWGRIYAIMTEPSDNDYRPAKRVRVKSRISSYGGFKFNNLVDGDVVKIYSINGKKIAELTTGESSEGFEWKGRRGTNNSGDWAESGTYIYQIKLKEQGKIISGTIAFVW